MLESALHRHSLLDILRDRGHLHLDRFPRVAFHAQRERQGHIAQRNLVQPHKQTIVAHFEIDIEGVSARRLVCKLGHMLAAAEQLIIQPESGWTGCCNAHLGFSGDRNREEGKRPRAPVRGARAFAAPIEQMIRLAMLDLPDGILSCGQPMESCRGSDTRG